MYLFLTPYIPVERYITAEYDKTIVIFISVAENVKIIDKRGLVVFSMEKSWTPCHVLHHTVGKVCHKTNACGSNDLKIVQNVSLDEILGRFKFGSPLVHKLDQ